MRAEELYETINEALFFATANLHTTVVCKVTAVNEKTIACKPVINRVIDGRTIELPVFEDVPPIFMHGGTSYEAFPIAEGDYCLVFVSERCFDSWYNGDDFTQPLEMRMHDYSDGFALVGIQNKAGAITIPSVITKIGDMFANGDWEHVGSLDRTGNETITGNVSVSDFVKSASYKTGNETGQSGSFTDHSGKTITVTNGLITGGL